jgi:hypothetical protein
MLLQRQFELQRQGFSLRDAIYQAEKEITNYRVPSQIMNQTWMSQLMKSPIAQVFGRYHYGIMRSMVKMVQDILPYAGGDNRFAAVGKLMGAAGLFAAFTMTPWIRPSGMMSPIMAAYRQFTDPQQKWMSTVSTLLQMGPLINMAHMALTNQTAFGGDLVSGSATNWKTKVAEGLEGALKGIPNGDTLINAVSGHPLKALGSFINLRLEPPKPLNPRAQAYRQNEEAAREKNDAFLRGMQSVLDAQPTPSVQMYGRGSSGSTGRGPSNSGRR